MFRTRLLLYIALTLALSTYWTCAVTIRDVSSHPTNLAVESVTSSTSDAPFFTSGGISTPSDSEQGSGDENERDATKTALEWVFAIIAIVAIASIATWRYAQLRRRNESMRSFLPRPRGHRSESRDGILNTRERRQSLPHTTGLPRPRTLSGASLSVTTSLFYPPCLIQGRYPEPLEPAPAHLARSVALPEVERGRTERRGRRAARGVDIDESGRRGGQPDLDDWDRDDKEDLPAYESVAVAGPPRYTDTDLQYVGGVPLRVARLPIIVPESSPATSTERERELDSDVLSEPSDSPSPDRRGRPESSAAVDRPTPALNNADPSAGTGTNTTGASLPPNSS